jgi:hypothetical protein
MRFPLAVMLLALCACHDSAATSSPPPSPEPNANATSILGDGSAGKGSDDGYTPAEFKAGMGRFKDVGVYVDGKPAGFLAFGELPISLQPVWVKHKVNINKPLGCAECPIFKWDEQRYYRFNDYLRAIGIDLKTVKQIHVQGPKVANTIIATGADLRQPKADDFMFYFGLHVRGKPIPRVPLEFGNGFDPDKITAVMVYVEKTPPALDDDVFVVDGRPVDGIPYFGEPLRGGIRVYLDDKLAAVIKRQDLDANKATTGPDKELSWSFFEFLKSRGVDTSHVVEGWVIRDDMRHEKYAAPELATMTFEAPAKSGKSNSGAVLLGEQKVVANAIALHTHALAPTDLPVIRPGEEND